MVTCDLKVLIVHEKGQNSTQRQTRWSMDAINL